MHNQTCNVDKRAALWKKLANKKVDWFNGNTIVGEKKEEKREEITFHEN